MEKYMTDNKKTYNKSNDEEDDICHLYNNEVSITNDYQKKVIEVLNIFKQSFVYEDDYIYYMRWLSAKLNKPYTLLPKNIVCLSDSDNYDTFIESLSDFIKISKIEYDTIVKHYQFNEYAESSIVMVNKIPNKQKVNVHFWGIMHASIDKSIRINKRYKKPIYDENIANYIIYSKYINCGGLFNYQAQDEMFRRFKIIKRNNINYNINLDDSCFLYNLVHYIKHNFTSMNYHEYITNSEFEIDYIKHIDDIFKVLSRKIIEKCIYKKNILNLNYLVSLLNSHGCKTDRSYEYWQLEQKGAIKLLEHNIIIIDKDKLIERYLK